MKKYDNCIGERYGKLMIVEKVDRPVGLKYGGDEWLKCKCDCGNDSVIPYRALRYKNTKSCGCLKHRRGANNHDWTGHGEISGDYYTMCKRRARGGGKANRRPKEFTVSIEYLWEIFLKQNRRCVISGMEITFDYLGNRSEWKHKSSNKITASLDRIDSSSGYVEGNVQWVHKHVNIMKNDLSQDVFVEYCRRIVQNNS